MICFLTSSPVIEESWVLNPANGFIDELKKAFPADCRALLICSDPDNAETTDEVAGIVKKCLEDVGLPLRELAILDGRNEERAPELVRKANFLILAGGYVPTQNRFFNKIGLRALLEECEQEPAQEQGSEPGAEQEHRLPPERVLLGISAGAMNSADPVYARPTSEEEAADPAYEKFLPGLGLTKTMLLPHHPARLEIGLADSMGRTFYAIPDGSYLLIKDGREELRGEAYRFRDGQITQIASDGQITQIASDGQITQIASNGQITQIAREGESVQLSRTDR